jgi:hypothetical protein
VTIHLYGLTDQLSSEPRGKWGDIGDGPAAGDPLRPRQRSERLAAIIVAQDRDLGAEYNHGRVSRLRLRNRARSAFREIAYIPRSQFQGAPTLLGILYRLSGLECLLAVGEGVLEHTEAGLSHKIGMCGDRSQRQAHLLCGLCAFLPDKRNAHCRSPF